MALYTVLMIRHADSEWTKTKFCGWHDADLSALDVEEAEYAGKVLKEKGFTFDIAFTSLLKRTIKTLYYLQDELDLHWVPVVKHWRLNERMLGALQGESKAEICAKHGAEQVHIWRRAFAVKPPTIEITDERWTGHDARYKDLDRGQIPTSESLKDLGERLMPFWFDHIVPEILRHQKVLLVAHDNTLRFIAKYLEDISDDDITELSFPTAIPVVYELDADLNVVKRYHLADKDTRDQALDKAAR